MIAGLYVFIGVAHSLLFHFIVSPTMCFSAKSFLWFYCNTGVGLSHLVVTVAWPLVG